MDENAALLLQKTGRTPEWEDEECARYDHEALSQEFCRRLYPGPANESSEQSSEVW